MRSFVLFIAAALLLGSLLNGMPAGARQKHRFELEPGLIPAA